MIRTGDIISCNMLVIVGLLNKFYFNLIRELMESPILNYVYYICAVYLQGRTSLIALSTWTQSLGSGLTSHQSLRDCPSQRNITASVTGSSLHCLEVMMIMLMVMRTYMKYPMVIWKMDAMGCLMDTCQQPQHVSEKLTIRKGKVIIIALPHCGNNCISSHDPGVATSIISQYIVYTQENYSFLSVQQRVGVWSDSTNIPVVYHCVHTIVVKLLSNVTSSENSSLWKQVPFFPP